MSFAAKGGVLAGSALLVLSAFFAFSHVEAGDSYCGTVVYDTHRDGGCADRMREQTMTTSALAIPGLGLIAYGVTRGLRLRARPIVLGLASLGCLAGAANRLFQPINDPWCGSFVNRHRYYDAEMTRRCSATLRPMGLQAVVLVVVAFALGVAAVRAQRHDPGVSPKISDQGL